MKVRVISEESGVPLGTIFETENESETLYKGFWYSRGCTSWIEVQKKHCVETKIENSCYRDFPTEWAAHNAMELT